MSITIIIVFSRAVLMNVSRKAVLEIKKVPYTSV